MDRLLAELARIFGGQSFGWNNLLDWILVAIFVY